MTISEQALIIYLMDGLSSISDKNGFIKIIAIDHRDSLKKVLDEKDITKFKTLATREFAPFATAVLLDRTYGHQARLIARSVNLGVIWSAEKSGYTDTNMGRKTELYEDFNPGFEKENLNVVCIKLLLYYNRNALNAKEQIEVAREVKIRCEYGNIPLLIEPITYPVEKRYVKAEAIVEAVEDLQKYCDILKLEFPLDVEEHNSLKIFIESEDYLKKINQLCKIPWILLSRGMKFKLFKEAVKISKRHGAKGYAVGRAVWQEIETFNTWEEKANFIKTVGKERMRELSDIYN